MPKIRATWDPAADEASRLQSVKVGTNGGRTRWWAHMRSPP